METIKNYLETMFANLPKTSETLKIKNDLLSNMEEKYNELKNEGKSENEAIGIVISEFGNIDELINELGIDIKKEAPELPTVTEQEATNFMAAKKSSGLLVAFGVFLCILGAAMLILTSTLIGDGMILKGFSNKISEVFSPIVLFIFLVPAVALFIYSGMKLEKYKYLKNSFNLPLQVKTTIEQKYFAFTPTYTLSLITGVCLCVLSPIVIIITSAFGNSSSSYGVVILLLIVSIAVFLFIYFGNIKEGYNILLKTEDFSKEKTEDNKVIGAVASIIWPLAVCIFLISGFIFDKWDINWIIFPITGVLFGMFSATYSIIKGHNN